MRALFPLLALVVGSIGSAVPAHAGSLPPLLVTARLYAWHGHWIPVDWKQMENGDPLRVAVQVSTPYSPATGISVHAALRHVIWPASHAVIEPADVEAPLRQTMQHGHLARFQAIFHVPVTHPLDFSRVVITVTHGTAVETVTSGVTFEPPTTPARALLRLTVPRFSPFARHDRASLTSAMAWLSAPMCMGSSRAGTDLPASSSSPIPGRPPPILPRLPNTTRAFGHGDF